jgi:hypothetical protein
MPVGVSSFYSGNLNQRLVMFSTFKKVLKVAVMGVGLGFALAAPVVHAQTTDPDPVQNAEDKIDQVNTVGGKAYTIAAGLALTGVLIGFIRKAKR